MRKGLKVKPEEIINILRQVEILTKLVLDALREVGISECTYYRWRKQYSGVDLSHIKELKRLQEENGRLKRAVADLTLDKLILNEALSVKL